MRTLKYAILGLLSEQPLSGYDITKAFNGDIGYFWSAKHSQIYPELKKLENEGLVEYEIEISGEILEKKVYTITSQGKEDLLKWLNKDEPMEKTAKDKFRLRMFFNDQLPKKRVVELLISQQQQHQNYLDELLHNLKAYKNKKPTSDEVGNYLVLKGAISREKAYIEWLNECLSYYQ